MRAVHSPYFFAWVEKKCGYGNRALKKVDHSVNADVNINADHVIYKAHCPIYYGDTGEGDARVRKAIKSPPQFNLTLPQANDDYLFEFIAKGGEAMGRSATLGSGSV